MYLRLRRRGVHEVGLKPLHVPALHVRYEYICMHICMHT